ncbi:MAG: hypothetical protein Q8O99_06100 [bacterium]|nr:hypothetical protein [bacterium]
MNAKQVQFSELVVNSENCKYCYCIRNMKNSYDITHYGASNTNELLYECEGVGHGAYHLMFCKLCWGGSRDLLYCYECNNCANCFGSVGLRSQEYCIFNKQYTKEDYEKTVGKIITHMQTTGERGEFFYPSLSPFGYNESIATNNLPLTKDEATRLGYKRSDYEYHINIPENAPVIKPGDLSAEQRQALKTDDTIINKIILCEVSGKPFRIIRQELEFYRKHDLPLPKKHPEIRHQERFSQKPGGVLHLRTCDRCGKQISSVYPIGYAGQVCCESCYQQMIYA